MKTLTILSVLQTIAIVLLLSTHLQHNHSDDSSSLLSSNIAPAQESTGKQVFDDNLHGINEKLLRQIIAEEMRSLLTSTSNTAVSANDVNVTTEAQAKVNPRQVEQVEADIEYYRSIGEISEPDMAKLQTSIAQLDGANRSKVMSKLIKALNEGYIKGQL